MNPPVATVVITTKNRRDELRLALQSAVSQNVPVEVLVIDDGSTDGTTNMVQSEFSSVRIQREEESRGLIVRRNQGARLAQAPIIFSIDDDAAFSTPYVVEQTLREFEHPRVGAVAIPFINIRQDEILRQRSPDTHETYVTGSYIGTAHALRRDVFLRVGGYREHFVHQGEEGDYCLRMLAAGFTVRLGTADPIHHFESPRRNFRRMDFYGRRNDVLFTWHNVPWPYLPFHAAMTTLRGGLFGLRIGRPLWMWLGLLRGYLECIILWGQRRPVPVSLYQLHRELKRAGARRFQEIEPRLPPLGQEW